MEPFEERICDHCGSPIRLGEEHYEKRLCTSVLSSKSGRPRKVVETDIVLHLQCYWPYLERVDGPEYDALMARMKPVLEKVVIEDYEEEIREEMYEEAAEVLGKTCVLCGEELSHLKEEVNAPDTIPPRFQIPYFVPR